MASNVSNRSVYEQTRREHEQIRERLKLLHHELELRHISLTELKRQLLELRDCLDSHFHKEEHDGFFDQIVSRAPQLSRQADSLTREHLELLQQFDSLVRFASGGVGQPPCWRTLTLRFEEFVKQLMHHECEENGMLQQAYVDDLGTKD